ncbi:hypothetical protein CH380_03590 [Leptospira adleri]|uniref:Uncharacterized protein n=1 Tax=Leptospira adleri TaxID=2023186 RepID=A0A2M9YTG5_9LEPT|nr:hypothetical protein [Leptospira adleri]PJZ54806.1 hypothetical protein CH380_03590 [Leptospira adleri]
MIDTLPCKNEGVPTNSVLSVIAPLPCKDAGVPTNSDLSVIDTLPCKNEGVPTNSVLFPKSQRNVRFRWNPPKDGFVFSKQKENVF